jgi:hypothetical protein
LLAPLVQEWDFTVKLQTDAGYNKGTVWAEMMGRIRKCCPFEVRDFKGHALQMCNIGCALPRVVLLLARSTHDQQRAALRHLQTCVKCGGSLTAMSTILRSLIRNPAQPIPCQGVSAKSLQLTRASSTRETKKAEKKAERAVQLAIWQREVQKPAVLKLRKTFTAMLDALSDKTIPEEHQVEDMSLGPRLVLKPSYFRALTNEAGIAKMLFLAVHGHMVVGQVAELKHPGIFHLCRQKPPPEAANSQFFPSATSTYSCLQMAAGRRDNSAGSQGYAFVVAKSVCLPVSPDMLGTHIPGTVHSLDWANVQAYASIFQGLISPEMDALVDGVVDGTWYVWVSVDYRDDRSNPVLLPMGIKGSDWSGVQPKWLKQFLHPTAAAPHVLVSAQGAAECTLTDGLGPATRQVVHAHAVVDKDDQVHRMVLLLLWPCTSLTHSLAFSLSLALSLSRSLSVALALSLSLFLFLSHSFSLGARARII